MLTAPLSELLTHYAIRADDGRPPRVYCSRCDWEDFGWGSLVDVLGSAAEHEAAVHCP